MTKQLKAILLAEDRNKDPFRTKKNVQFVIALDESDDENEDENGKNESDDDSYASPESK